MSKSDYADPKAKNNYHVYKFVNGEWQFWFNGRGKSPQDLHRRVYYARRRDIASYDDILVQDPSMPHPQVGPTAKEKEEALCKAVQGLSAYEYLLRPVDPDLIAARLHQSLEDFCNTLTPNITRKQINQLHERCVRAKSALERVAAFDYGKFEQQARDAADFDFEALEKRIKEADKDDCITIDSLTGASPTGRKLSSEPEFQHIKRTPEEKNRQFIEAFKPKPEKDEPE